MCVLAFVCECVYMCVCLHSFTYEQPERSGVTRSLSVEVLELEQELADFARCDALVFSPLRVPN